MKAKKVLSFVLASALALSAMGLAGCGEKAEKKKSGDNSYTYWIFTDDGAGTFYEKYEDNPTIEWLNQQYWDTEKGGIGTEKTGEQIKLSFMTPIAGSEHDNFNTMISTGEYPELIDMSVAGSAQSLYEDGVLIELTDYIDKYMPNYKKIMEENDDIRAKAATYDENGDAHYYSLVGVGDGRGDPWGGYMYRRDWVVKYATPHLPCVGLGQRLCEEERSSRSDASGGGQEGQQPGGMEGESGNFLHQGRWERCEEHLQR